VYPLHLASLFPSLPVEDKVFVAMSFDDRFRKRYEDIIYPAISNVTISKKSLQPYRVDTHVVSDSILKEIIASITSHRLIFADITTIGRIKGNAVRNTNVMYEVGLAHVLRQPEEVILFRSDRDRLPFDIANVRVNTYDPDGDPDGSRNSVEKAVAEAIDAIDFTKSVAVSRVIRSLDVVALDILASTISNKNIVTHPPPHDMRAAVVDTATVNAIGRLLDLGILRTKYPMDGSVDSVNWQQIINQRSWLYELTEFGIAVRSSLLFR
jgi:hypothetical protein